MPSNNLITKKSVLITRPEQQGLALAKQLQALNIEVHCQPLFSYQAGASTQDLHIIQTQTHQPILIFISVAAVEYAHKIRALENWPYSLVIGVGSATQKALQNFNIKAISPDEHHSEGLLGLAELSQVAHRDVIIIKGDGGRELIATTLQERKANVHLINVYQRIWLNIDKPQIDTWRKKQINCIVITSNALLERIVHLLKEHTKEKDNNWKTNYLWVVASKRIAEHAQALGLKNVINAHGASNTQIVNAILNNGIAQ